MSKEQLKEWLADKKLGAVILVCPRCHKVDINPRTHLEQCDPADEGSRAKGTDTRARNVEQLWTPQLPSE